jgi:tetratricopeptide (TPR) repeat protein
MTPSRISTIAACLLAAALCLPAQPAAPIPSAAPLPPLPIIDMDAISEQAANTRAVADEIRASVQDNWLATSAQSEKAQEMLEQAQKKAMDLQYLIRDKVYTLAQNGYVTGAIAGRAPIFPRATSEERLYGDGIVCLDGHRFDDALAAFGEVAARGGSKAAGALYYKAYTLNKLGRRDDALGAIAELRKAYPNSRWLGDAQALEIEIKQAAGKPVSPDELGQDDLKLLALNGIMQTEPDRALPILEELLKGVHSPSLKRQAVFVLGQDQSPKAQALLERIARGSTGNPDLQLRAVSYLVDTRSKPNRGQLLADIYASTNDTALKSAILSAYRRSGDAERLAQAVRIEKNAELRDSALRSLGEVDGQPELWQLYAAETTAEGKKKILRCMFNNGNTGKLAGVARTDQDAGVRQAAIDALASHKGPNVTAALVAIYGSERDVSVKKTVIQRLADRRDAKSLMDVGRQETDVELQKVIVTRLAGMKTPEATDYLLEVFKK